MSEDPVEIIRRAYVRLGARNHAHAVIISLCKGLIVP